MQQTRSRFVKKEIVYDNRNKKGTHKGCLKNGHHLFLFQMFRKMLSHIKHRNLAFTCKN